MFPVNALLFTKLNTNVTLNIWEGEDAPSFPLSLAVVLGACDISAFLYDITLFSTEQIVMSQMEIAGSSANWNKLTTKLAQIPGKCNNLCGIRTILLPL